MIPYFQRLLDILFPPACFACGKNLIKADYDLLICQSCKDSIVYNTAFTCPVCRGRVAVTRCHKNADYLLFSLSNYANPALRALIWQLKFRRRSSVARELARMLAEGFKRVRFPADEYITIPIPLHASRLRERGFNQAELLAENFSDSVVADALLKIRKTKPQTETQDHDERHSNLRNCFSVVKPEQVAGKNILLIDDVWTTGSTMNEAARALKLAGAKRIIGLTLAKAG